MSTQFHLSSIKKPVWLASLLVMAALILAGCQAKQAPDKAQAAVTVPTATSAPVPTVAPVASPTVALSAEAAINVAMDPKLGSILVDGKGMTLYMFTKDEPGKSNCDAACLAKWPPLLTQGSPVLGEGVDASLLGSATLADGSKIVTYNGMPLYYWVKDMKPGDTLGQGVGSVWYVVDPDGDPVGR